MAGPAFQFYPGDWLRSKNLRRCSLEARGAWIEVLCLMHDSDEYGVLRWPLADVAQAAAVPIKVLRELVDKGVLKGGDKGCEPFVHTPTHAGKKGDPVTLVAGSSDPVWYSSRMVRDEWVRGRRGAGTRFGETPTGPPDKAPTRSPTRRVGEGSGDGPASASASADSSLRSESETSLRLVVPDGVGDPPERPPDGPDRKANRVPDCPVLQVVELYHEVLPELPRVERITEARRASIRQRWREWAAEKRWRSVDDGLGEWRQFFGYVRRSKFLMGQVAAGKDRSPFVADLEWLMRPGNHVKVFEGRYHDAQG